MKKHEGKERKVRSAGQIRNPGPSYESERRDEEEGQRTRLNQSEIQEGPKGGQPRTERRRAA